MPETQYDLYCIGNAIVDLIVKADDAFVESLGFDKGSMNMIASETIDALFLSIKKKIGDKQSQQIREMSGGCASNTAAVLSSFGSKVFFTGKVGDDEFGTRFTTKFADRGITVNDNIVVAGQPTAKSLIFVNPDGERTMCTNLGVCKDLSVEDIQLPVLESSSVIFFTAYLGELKNGQLLIRAILDQAKRNSKKVAMSLADAKLVARNQSFFRAIVPSVDFVFGNKNEFSSLYEAKYFNDCVKDVVNFCNVHGKTVCVTCGKDGVLVVSQDIEQSFVEAVPVDQVIDKTGGGAAFAAGFLYGVTQDYDLIKSAKLGNLVAAECIQQLGARITKDIKDLVSKID